MLKPPLGAHSLNAPSCIVMYLNGPRRKRLKEIRFIRIVHHGQIHPGLLKPVLEAGNITLVLKRSA